MTKTAALSGKELDRAVAYAMGWAPMQKDLDDPNCMWKTPTGCTRMFSFSRDYSAMAELVNWLTAQKSHKRIEITMERKFPGKAKFLATFCYWDVRMDRSNPTAEGADLPEAISRLVLAVAEKENADGR